MAQKKSAQALFFMMGNDRVEGWLIRYDGAHGLASELDRANGGIGCQASCAYGD